MRHGGNTRYEQHHTKSIYSNQMKKNSRIPFLSMIVLTLFALSGCNNPIERKGIVVDRQTNAPLQDVSIEIYLSVQRRDSLKEKVFTDSKGHFHIKEKRDDDQLFVLRKSGYIGHTSSLSNANDTIELERIED